MSNKSKEYISSNKYNGIIEKIETLKNELEELYAVKEKYFAEYVLEEVYKNKSFFIFDDTLFDIMKYTSLSNKIEIKDAILFVPIDECGNFNITDSWINYDEIIINKLIKLREYGKYDHNEFKTVKHFNNIMKSYFDEIKKDYKTVYDVTGTSIYLENLISESNKFKHAEIEVFELRFL